MADDQRIFNYREALESFPEVRELTTAAVRKVEALFSLVQSREEMEQRKKELEEAFNKIVQKWASDVVLLGCQV